MKIDFERKELQLKIVYYGPAMSGKTTNLVALNRMCVPSSRGRLMTLETKNDRTLFFDLLPMKFESVSGLTITIKLFTVPGQVIHNATRRIVLQGADAVAFIGDSRISHTEANRQSFVNLKENLTENGLDIRKIPLVIQFNKRDLPDIRTDAEIDTLASKGREPVYKAIAIQGVGVSETFLGLVGVTWERLNAWHNLSEKFSVDGDVLLESLRRQLNPMEDTLP